MRQNNTARDSADTRRVRCRTGPGRAVSGELPYLDHQSHLVDVVQLLIESCQGLRVLSSDTCHLLTHTAQRRQTVRADVTVMRVLGT